MSVLSRQGPPMGARARVSGSILPDRREIRCCAVELMLTLPDQGGSALLCSTLPDRREIEASIGLTLPDQEVI